MTTVTTWTTALPILSAYEQRGPGYALPLVRHVAAEGYSSCWSMEAHGEAHNPNPVLTAGIAAGATHGLTLGAGIALHYWNPLRLAKDLHLLNALFPGRVDVALAPGSFANDATAAALRGRQGEASYLEKAADVLRYLRTPADPADQERGVTICHQPPLRTRPWVCTVNANAHLNERLAAFAARHATGFAYRLQSLSSSALGQAASAIGRYRTDLIRGSETAEPRVALICPAMCAATDEAAAALWSRMHATGGLPELAALNPGAVPLSSEPPDHYPFGGPSACRRALVDLAQRLGATELLVSCIADTLDAILDSYSLLARSFSLQRRGPA